MKKIIFSGIFILAFKLYSAGYTLPVYGYYDMARGGASLVNSVDLTANVNNPANLTKFKGMNSFLGLGILNTHGTAKYYDRGIRGDATVYDKTVENNPKPFLNPIIAFSDDFGIKNFNFSVAIHGPYAPDYKYNRKCSRGAPSCPNRYSLYESDITLANLQLSFAYRVLKNLSIGIGIKESYVNFKYDLDLINSNDSDMYPLTEPSETGETDTNLVFDVTDKYNFNVLLGLNYSLNDYLSFALTYQSPIDVDANGKMKAEVYDTSTALTSTNTKIEGEDLNVKLSLPHIFGAGILFKGSGFNLELDFKAELWSVHDKVVITPENVYAKYSIMGIKAEKKLGSITQKKNWKDTYSVRFGGDWIFMNGDLRLSGGIFYESGAIPDEYFDISIVDSDKVGGGLGVVYKLKDMSLNLAFSYIDFYKRDIKNSKVHPGNALMEDYPEDFIVGNGVFDTDMFIFSSGISYKF